MAKGLTLRQLSKLFAKQADIQARLSVKLMKDANALYQALPDATTVTTDQLKQANDACDYTVRASFTADGFQAQADEYARQADTAGEPA